MMCETRQGLSLGLGYQHCPFRSIKKSKYRVISVNHARGSNGDKVSSPADFPSLASLEFCCCSASARLPSPCAKLIPPPSMPLFIIAISCTEPAEPADFSRASAAARLLLPPPAISGINGSMARQKKPRLRELET